MKVPHRARTVTARGEPRICALDGHFLHATWSFSTSETVAKARHLRDRPADQPSRTSTASELAVFSHGQGRADAAGDPDWDETLGHWIAHYGSSPLEWGEDICLYRYRPHWLVGYAASRAELLATRGVTSSTAARSGSRRAPR